MSSDPKTLVRQLVRPLIRPLLARIHSLQQQTAHVQLQADNLQSFVVTSLEPRTTAVEAQLSDLITRFAAAETALQDRLANAQKTFDDVLNAVVAQNAMGRSNRRKMDHYVEDIWTTQERFAETLARLESRLEFVRKEVLLEIQSSSADPGEVGTADAKVVNPSKLEVRPLKLNLGAGHIPLDGYVNVDARPLPGVDVVAEAGVLPFDVASVDEIRSAHFLEHFPPARLKKLLDYWRGLLRPGGTFTAIVPDAESMILRFARNEYSWEDLKEVTFGGQEYPGDFHFSMFAQEELVRTLEDCGFHDVTLVEVGRRNGASLEMEVRARKPGED